MTQPTPSTEQLAREIIQQLRAAGHQAYLAGGCVRDRLLGIEPKDYDVATSATPDEISAAMPQAIGVGKQFGVMLVKARGLQVEVATFRLDHDYRDGRRPEAVSFTRGPEGDVQRRDFTINGLLYNPAEDTYLDYVGGRADLAAGLIRAIGEPERRFAEDHLRMLRAVRFAARLGFEIEPETFGAIRRHAPAIAKIAAERVRDELNRILTEGGAARGFRLLDESGLLAVILPEVAAMKGVEQPPEFHPEGDVWTHTLLMLDSLERPSTTLAWGVLLHDVGKPPRFRIAGRIRFDGHVEEGVKIAESIGERLRFSRDEIDRIVALVANHMKFMHVAEMRPSKLKRFLRLPAFDEHLALHRADCLASHGDLANYEFAKEKLQEAPEETLRPAPLITGHDLIAEGFPPGPRFGEILAAVEDAQLEGTLSDRNDAMAFVRERFNAAGDAAKASDVAQAPGLERRPPGGRK